MRLRLSVAAGLLAAAATPAACSASKIFALR